MNAGIRIADVECIKGLESKKLSVALKHQEMEPGLWKPSSCLHSAFLNVQQNALITKPKTPKMASTSYKSSWNKVCC